MSSEKAGPLRSSVGAARKVSPNWSQETMTFFCKVASVWAGLSMYMYSQPSPAFKR